MAEGTAGCGTGAEGGGATSGAAGATGCADTVAVAGAVDVDEVVGGGAKVGLG